jgi:hypothetical protein
MSNPTVVQSRNVPFAVSTDGNTYKNVVCKKTWGLTLAPQFTEEDSDCGTLTAVGSVRFSFDFEIVLNTTPNGATEISANEMAGYANNGTLIYVKLVSTGVYFRQGSGYITNYTESAPINGFVTATGTVTGSGTLDITE